MKLKQKAASMAAVFALTMTVSFTAPSYAFVGAEREIHQKDFHRHESGRDFQKDPIKSLEEKKTRVQNMLKEGKITKEKADELMKRFDEKIAEIKEFDKLPLDQKKQRAEKNFKEFLDKMVQKERMSQDEANKIMEDYKVKLRDWDGAGYPMFHGTK